MRQNIVSEMYKTPDWPGYSRLNLFYNPEMRESQTLERRLFQPLQHGSQGTRPNLGRRAMMLSYAPKIVFRWMNLTGRPSNRRIRSRRV